MASGSVCGKASPAEKEERVTSLEAEFAAFEQESPKHHGPGTWLERTLTQEELDFTVKLCKQGQGAQYIARFLKEKRGYQDVTIGEVDTYLKKVGAK